MKKLTLLLFLCHSAFAYGQVKFENKKLALLQDIFYKTTKKDVNAFMKDKGFNRGEDDKGVDNNIGDILNFNSQFDLLSLTYTKDNKIWNVTCMFSGAPNAIFIETELKNKGYAARLVKKEFAGETFNTKAWSIVGSKLEFITFSDEKEKVGVVGYGIFEE